MSLSENPASRSEPDDGSAVAYDGALAVAATPLGSLDDVNEAAYYLNGSTTWHGAWAVSRCATSTCPN